ncbi:universal stress protein [Oxalicibacterium flavum]|uniref:Universal stress protein n=1 Tax=Oxalicibacterium flavum TaxID=179467 RepID=A0A8J2UL99_9BURK|nr:universal stress protein [Oxalicibacterium flavum]GGC11803.1 universal stress protein [Oxalicibacterium flavum]
MFKTILCPTDGSALSGKAAEKTLQFAKENGSKVIGLFVEETFPYFPYASYTEKERKAARDSVQKIADKAAELGVDYEPIYLESASPYEEIIKTAEKFQCNAIFMGSHGAKGLDRLLLGSVTQKVLLNSSIPVVVLK